VAGGARLASLLTLDRQVARSLHLESSGLDCNRAERAKRSIGAGGRAEEAQVLWGPVELRDLELSGGVPAAQLSSDANKRGFIFQPINCNRILATASRAGWRIHPTCMDARGATSSRGAKLCFNGQCGGVKNLKGKPSSFLPTKRATLRTLEASIKPLAAAQSKPV